MDRILLENFEKYPAMRPADGAKLLYQARFGCGHLISDPEAARAWLNSELEDAPESDAPLIEDIGGGWCRINLYPARGALSAETLFRIFYLSAQQRTGDMEGFMSDLALLRELPFDREELETFLASYTAAGCPMLSHSPEYRRAYAPHYRVIRREFAKFLPAFTAIDRLSRFAGPLVIGIDGMCASGKTTLAGMLGRVYGGNIFHADDYFLPPEMRTPERLREPGGNMDRERLTAEVLGPLSRGGQPVTRRFDCSACALEPPVAHQPARVNIVEGSYTLHPELRDMYTLKIALRTSGATQLARLQKRDPERIEDYVNKWIPLENRHLSENGVYASADLVFDT